MGGRETGCGGEIAQSSERGPDAGSTCFDRSTGVSATERVHLTRQYGPKVPEIMDILGYNETLARLRAAVEHVRNVHSNQLKTSSDESPMLTGKSSE